MAAHEEIRRLVKEAAASMKSDVRGAVGKLEAAYALARETGDADESASVAEELARGWARRKSASKSLHYATKATKSAPARKAAWSTLAKTCELVATRTSAAHKQQRAQALYRAAATAFRKAASLTKDPEDKRWLLELAGDASRQGKSARP
jgi:ribosomal protein S20